MMYTLHYDSPLGGILLAADDVGLTGLWFDGELFLPRVWTWATQRRKRPSCSRQNAG